MSTQEKPIIFSSEMVRAILEGRKTQTRRVIRFPKYYDELDCDDISPRSFWEAHCLNCKECREKGEPCGRKYWQCGDDILPQQYHPGDRLWVRETWIPDPPQDDTWDYYGFTDGVAYNFDALPDRLKNPDHVIYRASWKGVDLRWRPSIFMPRWASRITLEITGVRVERVQDIHPVDCVNEGASMPDIYLSLDTHIHRFQELWNSINAKRGYGWDTNPWVWVIEFKRIKEVTNG